MIWAGDNPLVQSVWQPLR